VVIDVKNHTAPCIRYVATLPCESETLTSAKQAINDKLQGSVATYLRCGRVVNHQIRKGLLLSLSVIFFKSVNIWQERDYPGISCTPFVF